MASRGKSGRDDSPVVTPLAHLVATTGAASITPRSQTVPAEAEAEAQAARAASDARRRRLAELDAIAAAAAAADAADAAEAAAAAAAAEAAEAARLESEARTAKERQASAELGGNPGTEL